MKAIIVEDEPKSRKILLKMLEEHCPSVEVVGEASGIEEGIALLKTKHTDVVFMDIGLSAGTAFDLLKALPAIDFHIIFTTAYSDFAIDAIRVSALDYLVKPINIKDLCAAVKKAETAHNFNSVNKKIQLLMDNLGNTPELADRIAIPTSEGLSFLRFDAIVRLEASGSYTIIITNDGKSMLASRNIKHFETHLPRHFFRIHDSHIVNLSFVRKYVKGRGGYVVLDDNTTVEVSSRKRDHFLEIFG
jgi:two-component system LytT family response regulator